MQRTPYLACCLLLTIVVGCSKDSPCDPSPDNAADTSIVPSLGLVAYYALDGDGTDSGPNRFHASHSGKPTTVPDRQGRPGKSIRFDGRSDYMVVPKVRGTKFELRDAMTISFWVYGYDANPSNCCGNILTSYAPFSDGWAVKWFHNQDENLQLQMVRGSQPSNFVTPMDSLRTPNAPFKGAWYHVAYTYSRVDRTIRLWVNGFNVASKPGCLYDFTQSANEVFIGGASMRDATGAVTVHGAPVALDDLRIYEIALTRQEIHQLSMERH